MVEEQHDDHPDVGEVDADDHLEVGEVDADDHLDEIYVDGDVHLGRTKHGGSTYTSAQRHFSIFLDLPVCVDLTIWQQQIQTKVPNLGNPFRFPTSSLSPQPTFIKAGNFFISRSLRCEKTLPLCAAADEEEVMGFVGSKPTSGGLAWPECQPSLPLIASSVAALPNRAALSS